MVKLFKYGIIFMLIVGCEKSTRDEVSEWIVVSGVLEAGVGAQRIQLQFANDANGQNRPVEGAEVVIRGTEEIFLSEVPFEPGVYQSEANTIVEANEQYELLITYHDRVISSQTKVPKQVVIEQVSSQLIPIDPNSNGQPIFSVLWENTDEYAYVLTLKNIEASPEEIPFSVPSGQFDEIYCLPIPTQGATLYDTDFKYYGDHILTIYAITKEYEEVFFYNLEIGVSQLDSGPDNIVNGSGFFTGVSFVEIPITLIEI